MTNVTAAFNNQSLNSQKKMMQDHVNRLLFIEEKNPVIIRERINYWENRIKLLNRSKK